MLTEKRAEKFCFAGMLFTLLYIASTPVAANDDLKIQYLSPVTPHVFNESLSNLPDAEKWKPGDAIKEIPKQRKTPLIPVVEETREHDLDPLLNRRVMGVDAEFQVQNDRAFSTPDLNFNGQGYSGVNPPDTVGDVGKDYYIQIINGSTGTNFVVYNKSDGSIAKTATALDSLGSGVCANGLGDPIVLYDEMAERWMMSEFSQSADKTLCVYISQTSDPVNGGWFNYAFVQPTFPDYPKYAVWPDGYYVSANEGPAVYVLERVKMLNGEPASAQRVAHAGLSGFGFQAMTPADLDGANSPPTNSPALFMRHRDDEAHNVGSNNPGEDYLELWEYSVDWVTPGNSSFTKVQDITVSEFDSNLCGLTSFNCFPQPGSGTTLDPLREVIMWRLQYRNFLTHESLVGNFTTDADGNDVGGIRWFELRRSGGSDWSVYQEGTHSPDSVNRWMGSISMDGSGNIAVGYNVSDSTSVYPGLRYAGRLVGDSLGTLPQGEFTIVDGSAANASNRYGDYSAMSVDPVDDCTFWFTGQFNTASTWSTRINKMKFDGCTGIFGDDFSISSSSDLTPQICAGASFDTIVDIDSSGSFTGNVSLSYDPNLTGGLSGSFSPSNPHTPPASVTSTIQSTGGMASGSYPVVLKGTASGYSDKTLSLVVDVFDGSPANPALTEPASNATDQLLTPRFSWASLGEGIQYQIQIATDIDFNTVVDTAVVSSTSYVPGTALSEGSVYYWRVRASNVCGQGGYSTPRQFTTGQMICSSPQSSVSDTTIDVVNLSGSKVIADLDVKLILNHAWVGDVVVKLTHGSTTVNLLDRPGVPASSFGCSQSDINVEFDDSAPTNGETMCNSPAPALSGDIKPFENLSAFIGHNRLGAWTLTIEDLYPWADDGTLVQWCLLPTYETVSCDGANAVLSDTVIESGETINCNAGNIQVQNISVNAGGTLNIQKTGTATLVPDVTVNSGANVTISP